MRLTGVTGTLAIVAGVLIGGPAAAAKLYKWVDEQGNVTFSQTRPPGHQAEEVRLRGYQAPAAPGAAPGGTAPASQAAGQQPAAPAAPSEAELKQRKEEMARNCEIARDNLRILQNAPRIRAKDAEGKAHFLGPKEIKERTRQAERQIKTFCG